MPLVRCPIHKIPYNDENPRGCPACAREREGGGRDTQVMKELARVSHLTRRPSGATAQPPAVAPAAPVTARPRMPIPGVPWFSQLLELLRHRRNLSIGGAAIALLIVVLVITAGPRFTDAPSPATHAGVVRPLPIFPNYPVTSLFSALGPQPPQPNPTAGSLERYSYGTDLAIDAENGVVYAITMTVPNRTWRGLRVGMSETNAQGALAMLGAPRETQAPPGVAPDTVSGFVVYRSLAVRPRRALLAEVRPPNNCFDVLLDLQPRAIGVLTQGARRWAVVSRVGGPIDWVVTRIRVVSRSMPGPYAGEVVC